MTPTFPIATDNIYKFTCLFGLALIIVSILSFVSMYNASLDRKVKYMEVIIPLEAKAVRSKAEEDLLEMNKNLLDVTKLNEKSANLGVSVILGFGITLSVLGALRWYGNIQLRDDKLAQLQIEKLEVEISKLRAEVSSERTSDPVTTVSDEISKNKG